MISVAVLGGSGAATPELAWALRASPLLRAGVRLTLIGRDATKLERVARGAAALSAPGLEVTWQTDVRRGLTGADFVVNQVRVGGLAARRFDETFPREVGLLGEETVAPGGFANALRTVPVVLDLARVIEAEAPTAWVVNLTNPAGIVQQALERATRLLVLSVCDSPVTLIETLREKSPVRDVDYVGLNHGGWVTGARDAGGQDVMHHAINAYLSSAPAVSPEIVRLVGLIPNPYMRYYYEPERMVAGQAGTRARAEELMDLEREMLRSYERPGKERPGALARRGAAWYGTAAVPAIEALAGLGERELVVCAGNAGTAAFLPAETAVEAPSLVTRDGISSRRAGNPPLDARALLRAIAAYEGLVVEGVIEKDESKLVRALMANPVVGTYRLAREVLERARRFTTP